MRNHLCCRSFQNVPLFCCWRTISNVMECDSSGIAPGRFVALGDSSGRARFVSRTIVLTSKEKLTAMLCTYMLQTNGWILWTRGQSLRGVKVCTVVSILFLSFLDIASFASRLIPSSISCDISSNALLECNARALKLHLRCYTVRNQQPHLGGICIHFWLLLGRLSLKFVVRLHLHLCHCGFRAFPGLWLLYPEFRSRKWPPGHQMSLSVIDAEGLVGPWNQFIACHHTSTLKLVFSTMLAFQQTISRSVWSPEVSVCVHGIRNYISFAPQSVSCQPFASWMAISKNCVDKTCEEIHCQINPIILPTVYQMFSH